MLLKKKKKDTFVAKYVLIRFWRGARVVEEARLESVYAPKAYRGFESPSLRSANLDENQINIIIITN